MLKNVVEEEVNRLLPEIYRIKPDLCRCQECRDDLLALTLKQLPPRYASRSIGEVFSRLEMEKQQWQIDMMEALLTAAEMVASKPQHSRKNSS